ncbi:nucleotidyltransferase domain-containing protein [Patescibacteria group bacterium]|nr:nucleotidyltransferase domain-containing protein [Patescibacteria group bacterium]
MKLFGSKARGDSRKDSDIDILVVLKSKSREKENFIIDLTVKILLEYGIDISPHIYSQKEYSYLNKIPSVFMQVIQKEAFAL